MIHLSNTNMAIKHHMYDYMIMAIIMIHLSNTNMAIKHHTYVWLHDNGNHYDTPAYQTLIWQSNTIRMYDCMIMAIIMIHLSNTNMAIKHHMYDYMIMAIIMIHLSNTNMAIKHHTYVWLHDNGNHYDTPAYQTLIWQSNTIRTYVWLHDNGNHYDTPIKH